MPPAVVNDDGVLTPYPHIRFTITAPLTVVSANFVVTDDDDPRGELLEPYLEVRNEGTMAICDYPRSVYLDFVDIATLLVAPPHHEELGSGFFDSTKPCIPPGGIGVLTGAVRGVSEADLAAASEMSISYEDDLGFLRIPGTEIPSVTGTVEMTDDGYVLRGEVTPTTRVRNVGVTVLPRDERGVIVDDIGGYPGDLGSIPAGIPTPFETFSTDREFSDYLVFASWINDDD